MTASCAGCGVLLTPRQIQSGARYHSFACYNEVRKIPVRTCRYCGDPFTSRRGNQVYCNLSCSSYARAERDPRVREACAKARAVARQKYVAQVRAEVIDLVPRRPTFTYAEMLRIVANMRAKFINVGYKGSWRRSKKSGALDAWRSKSA